MFYDPDHRFDAFLTDEIKKEAIRRGILFPMEAGHSTARVRYDMYSKDPNFKEHIDAQLHRQLSAEIHKNKLSRIHPPEPHGPDMMSRVTIWVSKP